MSDGTAPLPTNSSEYITLLAHYYRGEMGRMAGWRTRIDLTSNWAITVAGAMLSVSLSTPTAHHGVVLLAMLLVTLLLTIEARRYRFFDVYRSRVRGLERNWFAHVFAPEPEQAPDWIQLLARDLRRPQFRLTLQQALSRRLRRNYGWMYFVLLLAWLLKTTTTNATLHPNASMIRSFSEWAGHCQLGPIPGELIIASVAGFYGWRICAGLRFRKEDIDTRLQYGEVYV
jgi:uncharacterized membrane protein